MAFITLQPRIGGALAMLLACSGCLEKVSVVDGPDAGPSAGSSGTGAKPDSPGGPFAGRPGDSQPSNCRNGGLCREVDVARTDKLDLLFVIDNSNSMAREQAALAELLPRLFEALTNGRRFDGDPRPFPPAIDLHVGVVTTDMGLPGVANVPQCSPDGGDDGRLQATPHGDNCKESYPSFLGFNPAAQLGIAEFAHDVACIARVGTEGCGFEQPLESALKAVYPMNLTDAKGNLVTPNPVVFLATTMEGAFGRGDRAQEMGGNAGFLRNGRDSSLLAVIVMTDEDDCSMRTTAPFLPASQLPPDSPYKGQDLNLRCHYNQDVLYDVEKRYLRVLRVLRPDHPDRVVFGALVGVPADSVDALVLSAFDYSDYSARSHFYDGILDDPRMQEVLDPASNPGQGSGALKPSCSWKDADGNPEQAFPPRRIVRLAKAFGENGFVQSICQDDFAPALNPILDRLSQSLGRECMATPLKRENSGEVSCDVIWELPKVATGPGPAPTECMQAPFLTAIGGPRGVNDRGGKNCLVSQLAVSNGEVEDGTGWYYDDFSESRRLCRGTSTTQISFSPAAIPGTGVKVILDCEPGALEMVR